MDRLRDELRERALGALAVDRVEPQHQADEGAEEGDELDEREECPGRGEQHQEDERRLGEALELLPKARAGHERHDEADHEDYREEQREADVAEMVLELLPIDRCEPVHGSVLGQAAICVSRK